MAREVDVLAGLRWEEVGDAGPCGCADRCRGRGALGSAGASRASDGPHPDRARQFMPFAALRGYYDLVHAKEAVPESRRPLSDDEARALDDLIANLDRGDVVRCRYYEGGGYREAEGAVSQIDVTFRDLWIVRRRIPFSAIQSLELLYRPAELRAAASATVYDFLEQQEGTVS